MAITQAVVTELDKVVKERFPRHPFDSGITKRNFKPVMGNYLAMSLAFPYLQAGAQYRLITGCIQRDMDVSRDIEITAAVGAFLTWDEVGGHAIVQKHGNKGLPMILDTDGFHSNLLRSDIEKIYDQEVQPSFSAITKEYLKRLEYGLSAIDPVTRVSHMVAFEKHAGRMINALWKTISTIYKVDKDKLDYFREHVGGDDPAEEYHIAMTGRMIELTIDENDVSRFIDHFADAYQLNFGWCEAIKGLRT